MIKATLIPLAAPRPSDGPTCDPASCVVPGCGHDGRDPRDHGVRMLDALVEACRRLQGADVLPESHGATPRLTLTMDYQQLLDLSGVAVTETGEQLSASAVRRLCCDAEIIPAVLGGDSEVLDVGRHLRLATHRDLEGAGRPRPSLPLRPLHPAADDVSRPPRHPLGRRRSDLAGQHAAALRTPPPPRPLRAVADPSGSPGAVRVSPAGGRGPALPVETAATRVRRRQQDQGYASASNPRKTPSGALLAANSSPTQTGTADRRRDEWRRASARDPPGPASGAA